MRRGERVGKHDAERLVPPERRRILGGRMHQRRPGAIGCSAWSPSTGGLGTQLNAGGHNVTPGHDGYAMVRPHLDTDAAASCLASSIQQSAAAFA